MNSEEPTISNPIIPKWHKHYGKMKQLETEIAEHLIEKFHSNKSVNVSEHTKNIIQKELNNLFVELGNYGY